MIVFYLQQNLWGKNRDQQFQKVVDSFLIIILLMDINGGIYKMFYDSFLCQSHSDESAQFYIALQQHDHFQPYTSSTSSMFS